MSVFTNLFLSCEKAQDEHLIGYVVQYLYSRLGPRAAILVPIGSRYVLYTRERVAKYNAHVQRSGAVI